MSSSKHGASTSRGRAGFDMHRKTGRRLVRQVTQTPAAALPAGLALLMLPFAAQAQTPSSILLDTIPNVAVITPQADGSFLVTMTNGAQVVLSAAQVQIVDGEATVSLAVADSIADLGQGGEGGLGNFGTTGLGALGLGALAAGGGGGGGGDSSGGSSDTQVLSSSATVATMPYLNAEGFQDEALADTIVFTLPEGTEQVLVTIGGQTYEATLTDTGTYELTLSAAEIAALDQGAQQVTVAAYGAEDASGDSTLLAETQVTLVVDTVAPAVPAIALANDTGQAGDDITNDGALDISALEDGGTRSISVNGVAQGSDYTPPTEDGTYTVVVTDTDAAGNSTSASFTFTLVATAPDAPQVALANDTGAADGVTTDASLDISAVPEGSTREVTVNGIAQGDSYIPPSEDGTYTVVVTDSDVAGNQSSTALTFTLDTAAPDALDLALSNDTGALATDGITSDASVETGPLAAGSSRTYTLNGTVQADGYVPPTDDGAYTVTVADTDGAGNTGAASAVSLVLDTTAPDLALDPVPGGQVDLAHLQDGLQITGTTSAEDGQGVTVTVQGHVFVGIVADGAFAVTVPPETMNTIASGLADDAPLTVTADVQDVAGNAAEQAQASVAADFTGPSIVIDPVTGDNLLGSAEIAGPVTISGQTGNLASGSTVTVAVGAETRTATTGADGTWSVDVDPGAFGLASEGISTVSASVTDAVTVSTSRTVTTDLTAPAIAIDAPASDAVLNIADREDPGQVTGTSDAPDGASVTLAVRDAAGNTVFTAMAEASGGAFAVPVTTAQAAMLSDGAVYDLQASVQDAAGNLGASAPVRVTTDFSAPAIALDPLAVGTTLDAAEKAAPLTVTGTSDAGQGQAVVVTLGGQTAMGAVGDDGTWRVDFSVAQLETLSDGAAVTVTARVADAAGNPAQATAALATDFAPILTVDTVADNGVFGLSDAQAEGLVLSGTAVGLSQGDALALLVNGAVVGAATVGADGRWSGRAPAEAFDGIAATETVSFAVRHDASGESTPPQTAQAYVEPTYALIETGASGSAVTFGVLELPNNTIDGLAFNADIVFPAEDIAYQGNLAAQPGVIAVDNPADAATGTVGLSAIALTETQAPGDAFVTFDMTVLDATTPVEVSAPPADGGPTALLRGTAGDDTLNDLPDTGGTVYGKAGDDTVDLSGTGPKTVVFEATAAENGTDTLLGFTTGTQSAFPDAIAFDLDDPSVLRGTGTDMQILESGDALGADTGFVTFSTQLAGTGSSFLEAAAEGLSGESAGDSFFLLASDGSDTALAQVTFNAVDDATVQVMARIDGVGSATDMTGDIIFPDPSASFT